MSALKSLVACNLTLPGIDSRLYTLHRFSPLVRESGIYGSPDMLGKPKLYTGKRLKRAPDMLGKLSLYVGKGALMGSRYVG